MQDYFYEAKPDLGSRKSFALCGLGGSGKTQIALRFLFRNLSRYKTGVMFLNATSVSSLNADFARLHDLLNLGEAADKTASVKRWLSKNENSSWLMVFDSADDLSSVQLTNYFPAVTWGHIVVTSRDQKVNGEVTEQGLSVGPMSSHEAMTLLMAKAGIVETSSDDLQTAKVIIDNLGSLPLALDQAGAFIRSRSKSLKEYLKLYLNMRDAVLQSSPNLGDSEKTVRTVWELNFQQVERDSKVSANLLLLLCFLDSSAIPETMLRLGTFPQRRWDSDGEIIEVESDVEGVDQSIKGLIQDPLEFDSAIEELLSFSLITCSTEKHGLRKFSIHPLVQYCAVQRASPEMANFCTLQAVLLVCHAFPRSGYLEPSSVELGRVMMPHLVRVLSEYDKLSPSKETMRFSHELATTIISGSRFLDRRWKLESVQRVKALLKSDPDPYINASLAHRASSVFRIAGMRDKSIQELQDLAHLTVQPDHDHGWKKDCKYNALRGELFISHAQNLLLNGQLEEADCELSKWAPVNPENPSTLEKITSRARDTTLGKVLRLQGKFTEALGLVERVLVNSRSDGNFDGTGWHKVLVAEVADLYCELGREEEAETLLQSELQSMKECGIEDITSGRRLQRSLVGTYLGRNMFSEAKEILLHLKHINETAAEPTSPLNLGLYRTFMMLAMVAHRQSRWAEALEYWSEALKIAESRREGEGFNAGLIRYSMAHALRKSGDKIKSKELLDKAQENMSSESCIFWSPCFHSRWREYIIKAMEAED